MLRHLRITNFAILSDVAIDFAPGFNVLTGETGAGKSLIMDAVALLRGARARSDIPRAGADEAVVEAVFDPPADLGGEIATRLEAVGLSVADEIVVRRVISRGGRWPSSATCSSIWPASTSTRAWSTSRATSRSSTRSAWIQRCSLRRKRSATSSAALRPR
jgi:energy-coupling factor transporter ATP-binding protein EcfA2